MSRRGSVLFRGTAGLLGLLFCLITTVNVAYAIIFNGWDYNVPSAAISSHGVSIISYDDSGRITAFSSSYGNGLITYSNQHYNSSGNLVYTAQVTGISGNPYSSVTVTQVGSESNYECPVTTAERVFRQSEEVVSANILRTERRAVEGALYNRLRLTMLPGHLGKPASISTQMPTGMASGDAAPEASSWSVWFDGSLTPTGSYRVGLQNAAFNAMGLVGVEYAVNSRLLFGLSMGYSNMATTYYNGSGASQTDNGFVLNPYIGFLPIDNLLVAVQGGLILTDTRVSGHQFVAGTTLSHNRNYGVVTGAIGTDVSYAIVLDRLVITPHAGYSYSSRQPQSGGVKGVEQGMLGAGAMFGYNFERLTPFVSATYNYDTIGQTRSQREDMLGTAGLTYRANDRFQATMSVSNTFFRYKEYETTFDVNLRYTF